MRITKLYINSYKNLQDFTWELNPDYPVAVIVGKNASGKSNLLEAILTIFAQVRTDKVDRKFYFEIAYQDIDHNLIVFKNDERGFYATRNSSGITDTKSVFPKQIVAYYAGISTRMKGIIKRFRYLNPAYRDFDIIYTEPTYNAFSAIALLGSKLTRIKNNLLREVFGIDELEDFQIKIQKPSQVTSKDATIENFWSAKTNIRLFFETLLEFGEKQRNSNDYVITIDKIALGNVMDSPIINNDERKIYELLSETYLNGYIQGAILRIKKKGIKEPLLFTDLSEGEKQRIGLRGTIEIFLGSETLFLLDEPDSFAHPRWQWQFVPDLQETLGDTRSSQVIFVTHSPLVLSTVRDNAFMMENGLVNPIYNTYGQDVSFSLTKMDAKDRLEMVQSKLDLYFSYLQSGMSKEAEAIKLQSELEEILGINHPELIRASVIKALYE